MAMRDVYLGLGANLGNRYHTIVKALAALRTYGTLRASSIYESHPISSWPQPHYLNAVAHLKTSLDLSTLFEKTQAIEAFLGKKPKDKEAPRPIDIDILFFGQETHQGELDIPHKEWKKRLFVVQPLLDLTDNICCGSHCWDLNLLQTTLQNQKVTKYEERRD